MIGRGAVQRPWIFALIRGRENNPSFSMELDLQAIAHRAIDLIRDFLPKEFHRSRIRRFFFYFCNNFTFAHHIRVKTQQVDTTDEARTVIDDYIKEVPSDRIKIDR
jgi:tRNA-dihydrouridine synthase B